MRIPAFVPAGALAVAVGSGLYVSRGVLERVVVDGGAVRIALLPGCPAWAGFVIAAAIGLWGLGRGLRRGRERQREHPRPTATTMALPAVALLALVLPYLPWIADAAPVVQVLAGPGRAIVWLAVAAQLGWVAWQVVPPRLGWFQRLSIGRAATGIAAATLLISGLAAERLTSTVLFPAGDEPHYLIIAQSLWRDGDLAIENNHGRGDYREYFGSNLDPHYLTRGVDGQIYSIHPVGLPVLLTPFYALGGYRLVVAVLLAWAAAAATLMWRLAAAWTADRSAATFAWLASVGSTPFLLNAFTVYPEIAAGLAVMIAFAAGLGLAADGRAARSILVGVACGTLPWLSTKYAPMSAALIAVALARVWIRRLAAAEPRRRSPIVASLGIVVPYLLSLAGWFAFFFAYWGSPWPQAPYGALVQTDITNLVFGAPGLLFDQEYGLLAYAPVYILALTGLVTMWRAGGETRRRAIEIVLVFSALLGTVGAFRIWWGGSASPGRPLVSGLFLLGPPMAAAFHAARRGSAGRAAQHLLLWISAGIALTMVLAQGGLLINNGRDGSSALIEYLSPIWEAWTLAPSFTYHEAGTALVHSAAWLAIAAAAAAVLGRVRPRTPGAASLAALSVLGLALAIVSIVMPLLPNDPPQPGIDLAARSRLAGLDSFDSGARPLAVIYDPLRLTAATAVLPMLTLKVEPERRRDPQPLRVLLNGRFSLPAGHYRVDVQWTDRRPLAASGPSSIDLQIGRIGPPLERWPVVPEPGAHMQAEFSLPIDAGFVGFRGSRSVEESLAAITIVPIDVVDSSARISTRPVLAASRYGGTMVLFHDEGIFPEPAGFWTVGGRDANVTVALPESGAAALRMHSGPELNRVTLTAYGWREQQDLPPGAIATIALPDPRRRIVPVVIGTSTGFVPAEVDPASHDRRRLGAWVEIVPASEASSGAPAPATTTSEP